MRTNQAQIPSESTQAQVLGDLPEIWLLGAQIELAHDRQELRWDPRPCSTPPTHGAILEKEARAKIKQGSHPMSKVLFSAFAHLQEEIQMQSKCN